MPVPTGPAFVCTGVCSHSFRREGGWSNGRVTAPAGPRFLKMDEVALKLNVTKAQVYALVRTGDLPAKARPGPRDRLSHSGPRSAPPSCACVCLTPTAPLACRREVWPSRGRVRSRLCRVDRQAGGTDGTQPQRATRRRQP